MERTENDRMAKRIYVGEYPGSRSVGRPRKKWKKMFGCQATKEDGAI